MTIHRSRVSLLTAVLALALLGGCGRAAATVYYVDYAGGSDKAAGTGPASAWKHAPGDLAATGVAASTRVGDGDTIRFRGGVAYRGSIKLRDAGSAAKPLRYVGDEWGSAPAIFDGSDPVDSVSRCPNAAACGNAGNWQQLSLIRFTPPPTALIKFFDTTGILYQSQYPTLPDGLFSDDVDSYQAFGANIGDKVKAGELQWPEVAKRLGSNAAGTELSIWVQQNQVVRRNLTGVRGDTLVFDGTGVLPYTHRDGRYAIVGSPAFIDSPGQYATIGSGVAVAWLREAAPPTIGNGRFAIDFFGKSNIVVRGFIFEHFTGNGGALREGISLQNNGGVMSGVLIENNQFRRSSLYNGQGVISLRYASDVVIRGNQVRTIERGSGIRMSKAQNVLIENNVFDGIGRTGVALLGVGKGQVLNNRIDNMTGQHGNGMSFYLDNRSVIATGNTILNATRPMTIHGDKYPSGPGNNDLVIERNVMVADADGAAALTSWGAYTRGVTIARNMLFGPKAGLRLTPTETGVSVHHNVWSGFIVTGARPSDWQVNDNMQVATTSSAKLEAQMAKTGGILPANVCKALQVAPGTLIGNQWRCS